LYNSILTNRKATVY